MGEAGEPIGWAPVGELIESGPVEELTDRVLRLQFAAMVELAPRQPELGRDGP